jgi:arylsulfatase A-like enzyme
MKKVILITIDSLRSDLLQLYGGSIATPNIELLAQQSIVYQNVFSTSSHTKQSFPGILASNYPTSGGINHFGDRSSIAYYFRKGGFSTAGFQSNPLLGRSRGYAQGFSAFEDFLENDQKGDSATNRQNFEPLTKTSTVLKGLYRLCPSLYECLKNTYHTFLRKRKAMGLAYEPGEVINECVFTWLKGQSESFFLWIHYMDVHFPYAISEKVSSPDQQQEALALTKKMAHNPNKLTETELNRLKDLYAREIIYVDKCIGQLLDFLKQNNIWDNALIALTSDHGEAFMEHGECFHGDYLYNEFIKVPLMIKNPNWHPQTIARPVSLIDLAPTIVTEAGLKLPVTFEGRPLRPEPDRDVVIAESAHRAFEAKEPESATVIDGKWKLIVNKVIEKNELYNIIANPDEKQNLINEYPEVTQKLSQRLQKHIERDCPNRFPADELSLGEPKYVDGSRVSEEVKKRLRALGYFDED